MASCETSQWVSTSPYVVLEVTQKSSTATTVTLGYSLRYHSDYGPADTTVNKDYSVTINGSKVKSGTFNIDGISGGREICSGTVTINKGSSAKTISFSCSFAFNLTWSGSYCGTKTASGSISIPAISGYIVSYNANGGTGAPGNQTKIHGTTLTLSVIKPTRANYTFSKWNTKADGSGTSYSPGGSYTNNAAVTLYAIWGPRASTVTYNANGGTGAPSSQTKQYGIALTLSSTKPTRTDYTFQGWATSANGSVKYQPGGKYTNEESVTLYAVWSSNYAKPKITSLSADRCDSSGSLSDSGTYASVKFNWETYKTVSTVKIKWKEDSSSVTTWSETAVSVTGKSGSVSQVIGSGALNNEKTYSICVTVYDGTETTERYTFVSGMIFPIDVLGCGPTYKQGVAIGKPAENEEQFDVNWLTRIRQHLCVGDKTGHLDGKQGVFISNEGYMHLQRTSAQGNHPYIAFMLDDSKEQEAMIRYNSQTKKLELTGKDVDINYKLNLKDQSLSSHDDLAYRQTHPDTSASIGFGIGSGGTNRGIYDIGLSKWLFKYDGTDIFLTPNAGEFRSYYKPGDEQIFNLYTAGYLTNGKKRIYFNIPLDKPRVGVTACAITSYGGMKIRQNNAYLFGSFDTTAVHPSRYYMVTYDRTCITLYAEFDTASSNGTNNDTVGIEASISVKFL